MVVDDGDDDHDDQAHSKAMHFGPFQTDAFPRVPKGGPFPAIPDTSPSLTPNRWTPILFGLFRRYWPDTNDLMQITPLWHQSSDAVCFLIHVFIQVSGRSACVRVAPKSQATKFHKGRSCKSYRASTPAGLTKFGNTSLTANSGKNHVA